MKLLLRITPMILVVLGLFFIVGCEEAEEEIVDPLVGTWDFSNMEKTAVYTMVDSSFAPMFFPGDTVASGAVTWAQFQAMGVSGTVTLLADGSFTLSGNFPISSDTLGVAPTITPLTDSGTWSEDATNGTLLIDGAFYDLGGLMTLSDDETVISLVYAASAVNTYFIEFGPMFHQTDMNEASVTILGFTRQ